MHSHFSMMEGWKEEVASQRDDQRDDEDDEKEEEEDAYGYDVAVSPYRVILQISSPLRTAGPVSSMIRPKKDL